MNAVQDKIQAMIKEYDRRIEKVNKQKLLLLSISISFIVILGAYLCFAYVQFRKLTAPTNLVGMGYDSAMEMLPQAIGKIETYLIESAPAFVDNAFDSLLKQLPAVRKATQERIDLLIDGLLRTLEDSFSTCLKSIIGSYREDILSIADVKDKQQVYILAARMENDLRGRFDAETNAVINKFATKLENIDKELDMLVSTPAVHLTHEQALERRFLELWMQIVEERLPTKK